MVGYLFRLLARLLRCLYPSGITMPRQHSPFKLLLLTSMIIAVGVATFVRLAPLLEGGDRIQRQCVSEDGYLMLTIARNMALGRGFSVSDGTIPTNGTQPLAALLYAACFAGVGGDRLLGLYPVVGLQVVLSAITAFALYALTRRNLYRGPHAALVALIAACLWYSSPTSLTNTQNSLETGLCALLILASMALYDALAPRLRRAPSPLSCVVLGLVLGLTFLGRNDACFLIAAMLMIHILLGFRHRMARRAVFQALLIGLISVCTALPWLWFNVTRFGHVVPVSGRAESLDISFGHNLAPAFAAVVENVLIVLRIPSAYQDLAIVQVTCGLAATALACVALWKRRWLHSRFSTGTLILACFVGALFVYYALFFGMPSFLGRYLFPAVMLSALVAAAAIVNAASHASRPRQKTVFAVVLLCASVACTFLNVRIYVKGKDHLHFQVVDWVAANVSKDVWVGAVQTGTLGYYHDRTINLDGKVDPHAFAARQQDRIPQYVVERNVEYIADWAGIATWAEVPAFAANYELILKDAEQNLAVLRRRGIGSVVHVTH